MAATRKTNEAVRKAITDALLELMDEKPLDQIRISEVTRRARVARVSFYRNFGGKEDVLREFARRVMQGFIDTTDPNLRSSDPKGFLIAFLHLYQDNQGFVRRLMDSGRMDIVREEFNRAFGVGCEDRRESARRSFLAGGLYNLAYRWGLAGYDPSPERLAEFVAGMAKDLLGAEG